MYFIANFLLKIQLCNSGRNGNYENADGSSESSAAGETKVCRKLLKQLTSSNLLGGRSIVDVDACMTRLRVTVKDAEKVGTEEQMES